MQDSHNCCNHHWVNTQPPTPSLARLLNRERIYGAGMKGVAPLKPNTHRRRDETVESRRVGGVNTIRDDCRRIRSTILKLTKQTP